MTEALKGYPINGAYLSHEETIDPSPLDMDPEALLQLEVLETDLGGTLVYSSAASP